MIQLIKIGDKTYPVNYDSTLARREGIIGQIDYTEVRIAVLPDLEHQKETEVLCHEAVHGMLYFMGEHRKNNCEESVERITSGLLMLIRDNPGLFLRFVGSENKM